MSSSGHAQDGQITPPRLPGGMLKSDFNQIVRWRKATTAKQAALDMLPMHVMQGRADAEDACRQLLPHLALDEWTQVLRGKVPTPADLQQLAALNIQHGPRLHKLKAALNERSLQSSSRWCRVQPQHRPLQDSPGATPPRLHSRSPGPAAASQLHVPSPLQRRLGNRDATPSPNPAPEGLPIELPETDSDDDDARVSQQLELLLSTTKKNGWT